MALYPAAVKRLIPPGPTDPRITPRVAILHVDASGATGADLYRYFNGPSGGVESHFTIDYDGTVTQFRDTSWQADANCDANDFAISIETQGKAAGTWTDAQLAAIKALLLWLNATHRIPLVKCPRWDGSGVGYHILYMQQWAGGPRACPGPDRIKQFDNVLVPWMATGGQTGDEFDMATTAELEASIAKVLRETGVVPASSGEGSYSLGVIAGKTNVYAAQARDAARAAVAQIGALTAVVQTLAKGQQLTADQITAAAKSGAASALGDLIDGADVAVNLNVKGA